MGGYDNGRLAAETVASIILEIIKNNTPFSNAEEVIYTSIDNANNALHKIFLYNKKSLGSTLGACLIVGNEAYLFWIGDVKIIHIRESNILFESEDHSLINQLKKSGSLKDDVNLNSIRHVVTRSVKGEATNFNPEIHRAQVHKNDRIIICSDSVLDITRVEDLALLNFDSNESIEQEKKKYINSSDNSNLVSVKV